MKNLSIKNLITYIFFSVVTVFMFSGCLGGDLTAANIESPQKPNDNSENSSGDESINDQTGDTNTGGGNMSGGNMSGGNNNPLGVPAFVATGHMQSSMYSCDGGVTWKGYQTESTSVRCWDESSPNNVECNHTSFSASGLAYGADGFMATFGWGPLGDVVITANGNDWDIVKTNVMKGGVSYGNGIYLLNNRTVELSDNGGLTWARAGKVNFSSASTARKTAFVNQGQGIFFSSGSASITELQVSRDNGQTFNVPSSLPSSCGDGEMVYNDSTILLKSNSLCRSTDQGDTWQVVSNPPSVGQGAKLVYANGLFRYYNRTSVYTSVDGLTWGNQQPITLTAGSTMDSSRGIGGHIEYHPELDSYVAISQAGGHFYESTEYYHSKNGFEWTQVNKVQGNAPLSPHPVRHLKAGYIPNCQ